MLIKMASDGGNTNMCFLVRLGINNLLWILIAVTDAIGLLGPHGFCPKVLGWNFEGSHGRAV